MKTTGYKDKTGLEIKDYDVLSKDDDFFGYVTNRGKEHYYVLTPEKEEISMDSINMDSIEIVGNMMEDRDKKKSNVKEQMKLVKELRSITVRNKNVDYFHYSYKNKDSGEQYTTTDLDEVNMFNIYESFNEK